MSTKSFQPTSTRPNSFRSNAGLWGWLGLSLLLAVLAVYGVMAAPAEKIAVTDAEETTRLVSVSQRDPAAESVMAYLRAHDTNSAARPLDPAAQSALNYIRVHEAVDPLVVEVMEPATLGVLNYIYAHESSPTLPLDPKAQSVLDYLHAHGYDVTADK